MRDLQARHKEWSKKNFGGRVPATGGSSLALMANFAVRVGRMSHILLKKDQGIRKTEESSIRLAWADLWASLGALGDGIRSHQNASGADGRKDLWPLLGVLEEVGELFEAHRDGNMAATTDAVGDVVLYLVDYCNQMGIDFEDAVRLTAEGVHRRDWNKNQMTGEVQP